MDRAWAEGERCWIVSDERVIQTGVVLVIKEGPITWLTIELDGSGAREKRVPRFTYATEAEAQVGKARRELCYAQIQHITARLLLSQAESQLRKAEKDLRLVTSTPSV